MSRRRRKKAEQRRRRYIQTAHHAARMIQAMQEFIITLNFIRAGLGTMKDAGIIPHPKPASAGS